MKTAILGPVITDCPVTTNPVIINHVIRCPVTLAEISFFHLRVVEGEGADDSSGGRKQPKAAEDCRRPSRAEGRRRLPKSVCEAGGSKMQ